MNRQKDPIWNRREFLRKLSLVGGVGLLGLQSGTAAAEPPPETTKIRLLGDPELPVLCYAPLYVAKELLKIEGFTDVNYVPYGKDVSGAGVLTRGEADIVPTPAPEMTIAIDREAPIVVLGGLHVGCVELFANNHIRTIHDLKDKRVGVAGLGGSEQLLVTSFIVYIGFDPSHDIKWVVAHPNDWAKMLAAGEIDAVATFPPMSYDLHDRKIGHVILNITTDAPWRHYFCCMIGARREFVEQHPIASKRAMRALLKANQLCSLEPQRWARYLVDQGVATHYDHALQTLQDIPYDAWRSHDPEDSLRFYSLRLLQAGLVKNTPNEIIARGTDWRFLNELKRELKA